MSFIRTVIRLITGRVAFERKAAMMAIEHAADTAWITAYGSADSAAEWIYAFLLNGGKFPK